MKQVYIVTSITNGDINFPFLDSLLKYADYLDKEKGVNVKLKIMPTKSFYKNCGFVEELEPYLLQSDFNINDSLVLKRILQSDYNTNPLSGVPMMNKSVVVAGINHCFKTLPRQIKSGHLPTILCSTGSLNNRPSELAPTKSNLKAIENFVEGALIIEVVDNKKFHLRQIEFDGTGFYDLDKYITPKKVSSAKDISLVFGDLHPTEVCPKSFKTSLKMLKDFKPKSVVLHDWFNAGTISHHIQNNFGKRANLRIDLETEVKITCKTLEAIKKAFKGEVVLVSSNHPEHLEKYLDEGRYRDDVINLKYVSELIGPFLRGENIYKFAFSKFMDTKRITFLERNMVRKIHNIEVSNHGDAGVNGAKSCKNIQNKNIIFGHTHSPEITASGLMFVGTLTHLDLDYCNPSGFSSWLNTNAIIYKNGKKALLNIINGEYTFLL